MNCRIPPRHPFSGYLVRPTTTPPVSDGAVEGETCDYCGSTTLEWRKCKLICTSCAQINKSCADL